MNERRANMYFLTTVAVVGIAGWIVLMLML